MKIIHFLPGKECCIDRNKWLFNGAKLVSRRRNDFPFQLHYGIYGRQNNVWRGIVMQLYQLPVSLMFTTWAIKNMAASRTIWRVNSKLIFFFSSNSQTYVAAMLNSNNYTWFLEFVIRYTFHIASATKTPYLMLKMNF